MWCIFFSWFSPINLSGIITSWIKCIQQPLTYFIVVIIIITNASTLHFYRYICHVRISIFHDHWLSFMLPLWGSQFSYLFCRQGKWGTKRWSYLPKVIWDPDLERCWAPTTPIDINESYSGSATLDQAHRKSLAGPGIQPRQPLSLKLCLHLWWHIEFVHYTHPWHGYK